MQKNQHNRTPVLHKPYRDWNTKNNRIGDSTPDNGALESSRRSRSSHSLAEGMLAQIGNFHVLGGDDGRTGDIQTVVYRAELLVGPLVETRHRRPRERHHKAVHVVLAEATKHTHTHTGTGLERQHNPILQQANVNIGKNAF